MLPFLAHLDSFGFCSLNWNQSFHRRSTFHKIHTWELHVFIYVWGINAKVNRNGWRMTVNIHAWPFLSSTDFITHFFFPFRFSTSKNKKKKISNGSSNSRNGSNNNNNGERMEDVVNGVQRPKHSKHASIKSSSRSNEIMRRNCVRTFKAILRRWRGTYIWNWLCCSTL